MTEKKQAFEVSLQKLEQIVGRLEDGDLSLDESLLLFEEGVELSRKCQEKLDHAERRIEILLKDQDGKSTLRPIEESDLAN